MIKSFIVDEVTIFNNVQTYFEPVFLINIFLLEIERLGKNEIDLTILKNTKTSVWIKNKYFILLPFRIFDFN